MYNFDKNEKFKSIKKKAEPRKGAKPVVMRNRFIYNLWGQGRKANMNLSERFSGREETIKAGSHQLSVRSAATPSPSRVRAGYCVWKAASEPPDGPAGGSDSALWAASPADPTAACHPSGQAVLIVFLACGTGQGPQPSH